LELQLAEAGHGVDAVASAEEGLARMADNRYDVILTDLRMPGMDGLALLEEIKRRDIEAVIVVLTAHGDVESAVRALKAGAFDFLRKPVAREALLGAIARAANFRALYFAVARQREALHQRYSFERIVGGSPAMQRVFDLVRRAAPADATVLLRGETGTGKDLFGRAIHHNSRRADGPFVILNCAAIPETLLESAFFGHEKGAFTGADARRVGCYEEAHKGTLFLDEIGLLGPALQGKLLRVLEGGTLRRLGGTQDLTFDVRLVAATNSPLEEMVADGRFREDLYFRLRVVEIRLPPLRERPDDLPLLVDRLLVELEAPHVRVDADAMTRLRAHPWPGNVRELRNVLERALIVRSDEGRITADDLGLEPSPPPLPDAAPPPDALDAIRVPSSGVDIEQVERKLLEIALRACGGNRSRAARFLRLGRHALLYRLRKHGLLPGADAGPDAR
jgi:two-component system NtrC family response regulator